MTSAVEREITELKLRLFLMERLFWEFYMRAAPNTVAQSRQTASTLATQMLEQIRSRIESEFRTSDLWKQYHFGSAEAALKTLDKQVDELKKSIPVA